MLYSPYLPLLGLAAAVSGLLYTVYIVLNWRLSRVGRGGAQAAALAPGEWDAVTYTVVHTYSGRVEYRTLVPPVELSAQETAAECAEWYAIPTYRCSGRYWNEDMYAPYIDIRPEAPRR